jgi:four helix bundle protein
MVDYTKFRNINRGYMKLEVWKRSLDLHKEVWKILKSTEVDFKLRSQLSNASQSVSSNIAEGYSRRSIKEYIQFLYIALASLSETLTRLIGFKITDQLSEKTYQQIDELHYEVENKLLRLIESLEKKREDGTWTD